MLPQADSEEIMATQAPKPDMESDDALVARLAARDGECLRLVAERHGELVYRIGCRMLGDPHEAEDIAQEAILRLWTHAERWQPGGPGIAAWLSRVGTNLCIDRLRKRRRMSEGEVPDREDDAPLADVDTETAQTREAVIGCISELPERQRAAIVLTYYEDLPNRTACEALEMKIKAFESILVRARQALRRCIERKGIAHEDVARISP